MHYMKHRIIIAHGGNCKDAGKCCEVLLSLALWNEQQLAAITSFL